MMVDTFGGVFSIFMVIIPIFTMLVFALVIGLIIYTISKNAKQSRYNHSQPVLTVWAKVVATRSEARHTMHTDNMATGMHHSGSAYTRYYATFEVKSGDRMELLIPTNEIGYLVQGDVGELTFQGTEFRSFVRT